jgi:hypothetical protein
MREFSAYPGAERASVPGEANMYGREAVIPDA